MFFASTPKPDHPVTEHHQRTFDVGGLEMGHLLVMQDALRQMLRRWSRKKSMDRPTYLRQRANAMELLELLSHEATKR